MKNVYVIYGENFETVNDYEKEITKNYLKEVDEFNRVKLNMNVLYTIIFLNLMSIKILILDEIC